MGLFSFMKNAGAKLFGANEAEAAEDKAQQISAKLAQYEVQGVNVAVDDETVRLTGRVNNIKDKKKAIIIAGNVDGIAQVEDRIFLAQAEGEDLEVEIDNEKAFHTVQSGDTLSKIAQEVYGDPMKYPVIFEANKPMLTDPDLIYPGQMLIIPAL